ncbi:bifunctional glycosyltransferase/CDP-glycerol:glycerophosphate glycerophosphotransferase [Sporichthya polymorpha]|uniref:bifunctional glycosyltransferase/CDP-glycerol:glycerophosphate glycerophosphotransferase n=1 Tax=Sporichthya polymorpha TaxID=35751 RepID=UPI00035EA1BA|nr:CDP-glycerol glycerophosphotransferase family protein [Sporichthya polymorpha]
MTSAAADRSGPPRFSIVSAVYDVAPYLDDFIASIEAQSFPLDRIEILAVDDGSTDDSLARLRAWSERRPGLVTVLTKPNGGQASARNLGMRQAQGEWVTFTDPDDMIEPGYLTAVDEFLRKNPDTDLVGCRRILYWDSTKETSEHPLEHHFALGDRVVDLDESPTLFYASAPCAFVPLARVRDLGIEFDEELKPSFEDAHMLGRYLLALPAPRVGFLASADYLYRRRGDSTSEGSFTDTGRYTTVPRRGYLDLLRRGAERRGGVPAWVQNLVIYDLSWSLAYQDRAAGAGGGPRGAVAEEFHDLLAEITTHLDPDVIANFNARTIPYIWREILAHGYGPPGWRPQGVVRDRRDRAAQLDRVRYRYTGDLPAEEFVVDGVRVEPLHSKSRDLDYFERLVLRERIAWVPRGNLTASLDGVPVEVWPSDPRPPFRDKPPGWVKPKKQKRQDSRQDRLLRRFARTRVARHYLRHAWVLIDRVHDADDSAEHLFHWIRKNRPKTNAWFVIEKGTPDHKRLKSQGIRRVVPYDSLLWKLLMLNCEHLISSHADAAITNPPGLKTLIPSPKWRYSFLNHGVIKDDLSAWLNPKNAEIFVTSTPGEYESICGEGTRYVYTSKETVLSGMPRFDKVREVGLRFPPEQRDLILIAPTWRNWLVAPLAPGSQRRKLVDGFTETEFVKQWRAVLCAPDLGELAERHGLTVATLLHPNLQAVREELELPSYVTSFGFVGHDVRELFARSRVVVTDYSSMAFNAAYIDRPVVYFQFDHEAMFGGAHVGRGGYFKYERDGYGPVTYEADRALAAIREVVDRGPEPAEEYRQRIAEAFPQRDGRCSERLYEAIVASARPVGASGTVSAGPVRPNPA